MTDIFDIAKYILNKQGKMTESKLQKLCYYCQAWSLTWDKLPLFAENFEALVNGPVCPELHNYCHQRIMLSSNDFLKANSLNFNEQQQETIDAVLSFYANRELHWLNSLVRSEDPWRKTRNNFSMGDQCHNIISKESMQKYYSGISK